MLQLDMVPGACGVAVRTRDPGRVVLLCGPGTRGVWCCCVDPGPGAAQGRASECAQRGMLSLLLVSE